MQYRKMEEQIWGHAQKVENAGLENAGPRQLSDSTLKL